MATAVKLQASNTLRYQVDKMCAPVKESNLQRMQISNNENWRQAFNICDFCLREVFFISQNLENYTGHMKTSMNWDSNVEPDLDMGHMKKVIGNLEKMGEAPAPTSWVRAAGGWQRTQEVTAELSNSLHLSSLQTFTALMELNLLKLVLQDLKHPTCKP